MAFSNISIPGWFCRVIGTGSEHYFRLKKTMVWKNSRTNRTPKTALALIRWLLCFFYWTISSASETTLEVVYLAQEQEISPALSNLDPVLKDKGVQGARLATKDNNTTGRFTGHQFRLKEVLVPVKGDVAMQFSELVGSGHQHFIVNLSAATLHQLAARPDTQNLLFYDIATKDDLLRQEKCLPNVLHMLPSRAMRADALAQYMLKKRWRKWFLVVGPTKPDQRYAMAIKRAAKRYGMKIVQEKDWEHTHDARRTAQSEVPVFTQGVEYDILIVADEAGLFGEYLPYRTWSPRPVAGSQGLVPTAWHRTHEQWGAVQLQNRFNKQAGRWMTEQDYGAWLALRAVGEAATRQQSLNFDKIRGFLFDDEFALAGFKGKKLSFRSWNGQLRQPILLAAARSMVAVAPLDGFLHPKNELDTLGYDEPESKCRF